MISSLVTFVVLIALIQALRTRLVFELSAISLLVFGSTKIGLRFYSLIFLPGTIIHELSHWVVAEILQVKTGEITIFPDETTLPKQQLGSVATAKTDPLRSFLIGLAPFISGILILLVLGRLLADGFGLFPWWQVGLLVYGIIVISNSMMISSADRKSWGLALIFVIFASYLLFKYYPHLIIKALSPINLVLGVTSALNLVMIGGSYGLRRIVESITKKKIIHK